MTRRELISAGAAAAATMMGSRASGQTPAPTAAPTGPFTLPPLGYAFDALEPYIDAQTMQIHHDKHHKAYVDNLNKAVAPYPNLQKMGVEDLLLGMATLPEAVQTAVRNQGGGHANHTLFWKTLAKNNTSKPKGDFAADLDKTFGSFSAFQDKLSAAAVSQFGSGWGWLILENGALKVVNLPNQDSPLLTAAQPIFGIDVWEHAYYLKYQNRRPEYVKAIWNAFNWEFIGDRYASFKKS
jgi:Fe-Mn family superoxide dismutase